jgi:hypothetical protein
MEITAQQTSTATVTHELPVAILRETLSSEIPFINYWYRVGEILIAESIYKFIASRTSVKNPIVDYAERITLTPILMSGEELGLDFTKRVTYEQIMERAKELNLEAFPEQFVVDYGTNYFPWSSIGRNVKVMTNPIKRGRRDHIIISFSFNQRSIVEIVLTSHKFRVMDYFLFKKIITKKN